MRRSWEVCTPLGFPPNQAFSYFYKHYTDTHIVFTSPSLCLPTMPLHRASLEIWTPCYSLHLPILLTSSSLRNPCIYPTFSQWPFMVLMNQTHIDNMKVVTRFTVCVYVCVWGRESCFSACDVTASQVLVLWNLYGIQVFNSHGFSSYASFFYFNSV